MYSYSTVPVPGGDDDDHRCVSGWHTLAQTARCTRCDIRYHLLLWLTILPDCTSVIDGFSNLSLGFHWLLECGSNQVRTQVGIFQVAHAGNTPVCTRGGTVSQRSSTD